MAHTVWKGTLVFGQLEIPVKLSSAAVAESLSLSNIHQVDRSKVKQIIYCQLEDKPIPRSAIASVFEAEGALIDVSDDDVESAKPTSKDRCVMVQFVRAIDPVYFNSHYHVAPDGADERAYAALYCALKKTGLVGIGQICMYRRESVAAICAGRTGLLLHTLYHANEVRHIDEFRTDQSVVSDKELSVACRLVRKHAAEFDASKFQDGYRTNFLAMINSRLAKLPKPTGKAGSPAEKAA